MELKKEIRTAIDEQKQRKKKLLEKVETRNELLGKIRTALVQIDNVCKVIVTASSKQQQRLPANPIYLTRMPEQLEHNRYKTKIYTHKNAQLIKLHFSEHNY